MPRSSSRCAAMPTVAARVNLEAGQVPIALHTDRSTGGSIAYVGFVGSDGNTPQFVRAICYGQKVKT